MDKHGRLYVGVALLLLCGAVIGGVATRTYYSAKIKQLLHGDATLLRSILVDKYAHELNLDSNGRAVIEDLIKKVQMRLGEFRAKQEPDMQNVITSTAEEVKKDLSPSMQHNVDAIVQDTLERRNKSVQAQKSGVSPDE